MKKKMENLALKHFVWVIEMYLCRCDVPQEH